MRTALTHQSGHLREMVDDDFAAALLAQTGSLRAYARRLAGGGADADDLVQDTMLRCWTARSSFMPGTNLGAWSRTVMRNSFLSGRRRARWEADLPDGGLDRIISVSGTQESTVALHDLEWALEELKIEQREAVLLASQGVSFDEGAARLSIPVGTFKSRVWRARSRLRQLTDHRDAPLLSARPRKGEPSTEGDQPTARIGRDWTGVIIG